MLITRLAVIVAIAMMCRWEGAAAVETAAAQAGGALQSQGATLWQPAEPVQRAKRVRLATPTQEAATPPGQEISGHFALETVEGHEVTDATYRGKWLVVYFGYASCPDVCPTVL
ncbi:MAG TPA: SCO family protein, partial [Steroidobacteraceae bacterium]